MTFPTRQHHHLLRFVAAAVLLMGVVGRAHAFTATISTSNTRTLYLRVGDGGTNGAGFRNGGTLSTLGTINAVTVAVPAAAVGNSTAQAMTGNGRATSDYDNYQFCNAGDTYIGGFFQYKATSGSAVLSVQSSTPLSDGAGNTIPFPQISWTSYGNGDAGAEPIPAGTFNGGTQTLANFPVNQWQESCHSFKYANASVPAAGTYTGRVTYTLTSP
ncbi:MAG: hypothetical protein JF567_08385 [Xanthomonadales bacterium]|nr:hypothetical protein [Xanthomonadales bacterium]